MDSVIKWQTREPKKRTVMIKKFCIISVIACIVTFLLFAFAWWSINPSMWSDEGRMVCAGLIGIEILAIVLAITLSEGL